MGWGTAANVTTTHLDSASDDPSQARVEIKAALEELQAVINGRNTASGVAGLDSNSLVVNTYLPNTLISSSGNNLTLQPNTGLVVIDDIINLTPKTVSQLESTSVAAGHIAYCSNGNAGQPCLAVSLGTVDSSGDSIWYRIALGNQISAT
jgi:hypothetical protein